MATNPKPQAPWGEYIPHVGSMTVEQFEMFPGEEGWTYELHAGRLLTMPGPGNEHGDIQGNFFMALGVYLLNNKLGRLKRTSCYNLPFPGTTEEVLCPDLSYVKPAREAAMEKRGSYLVGASDLVIEIASPSDFRPPVQSKVQVYLQSGVSLIWVAWPKTQTIDVWRPVSTNKPLATLQSSDMLDGLDVIPGFACPVAAIFG